ncbi:MAG: tRNA lysidine(34) synthetase TilS [Candidatus Lindowbacteria bacterium]|nr:tRNA lysidine(34) synthetase TilS [Candidatus Lindowbacteria bacterium]
MDKFEEQIQKYVDADAAQGRIGVAVSGGMDSVGLLVALIDATDREIHVFHFDHAMREESNQDLEFVRGLASQYEVAFHSVRASEEISGGNIEEKARDARYAFFETAAKNAGVGTILTAHTADDQAETILFRISRGTGLHGLRGIPSKIEKNGVMYIRPFLELRKCEIEEYLEQRKVFWREDPSNQSSDFTRNRIRHDVLPYLEKNIHPQAATNIARLSQVVTRQEDWIVDMVDAELEKWETTGQLYSRGIQEFNLLHPGFRSRIIYTVLKRLGARTDVSVIEMLINQFRAFEGEEKVVQLSSKISCRVTGGRNPVITFGDLSSIGEHNPTGMIRVVPQRATELPGYGATLILREASLKQSGMKFTRRTKKENSKIKEVVFMNADDLHGDLFVRTRRVGDSIKPMGLRGAKKLQDIFVDAKISRHVRDTIPVLCDDIGPIYIPGLCQDERTRVTKQTTKVYRLEFEQEFIDE